MLTGLNHITLAVSNLDDSLLFYIKLLGFTGHVKWNSGAYLTLGDLWLCLSCGSIDIKDEYTHISFSIAEEEFHTFAAKIKYNGIEVWKQNTSEGDSLYILDPDGHKLEIHSGNLQSRLRSLTEDEYEGLQFL